MNDHWDRLASPTSSASSEAKSSPSDLGLRELWQRGRAAWPQLDVPLAAFCEQAAPDRALRPGGLHAEDLYLACGCALGDAVALQLFEDAVLVRIPGLIARLRPNEAFADEVRQQVRLRLLLREAERLPRIGSYQGTGSLLAFVRITALRIALNLRSQRGEQVQPLPEPEHERLQGPGQLHGRLQQAAGNVDPELRYLKERYRREFESALAEALAGLSAQQRNLLRLRFIGGLTDARIGVALGVHQTTATRWLAAARSAALESVRSSLKQRLQITSSEFESLVGLIQSQLELDLPEILKSSAAEDSEPERS